MFFGHINAISETFKNAVTRNEYWGLYVAVRFTAKKVEEVITRILHDEGLALLAILKGRENISEFDIAKEMNKDIKIVRRMLYLLYNSNLVTFTRKKDKQKGWYVYYWTLDLNSVKFNYIKEKREQLLYLQETLEKEEKELFFVSPDGSVRLNFDDAMEFDFQCPETGELMQQDDNSARISQLQQNIKEISSEITEWEKAEAARIKAASKKVEEERKREEAAEKKAADAAKKKKEAAKKKKAVKKKTVKKKTVGKKKKTAKKKKVVKKKTVKKKTVSKKKKTAKKKKAVKKKK